MVSELTFNLLRLGYLLLLWLFVLAAVAVLRRDISVRGHSANSRSENGSGSGVWVAPGEAPITPVAPGVPGIVGSPDAGVPWPGTQAPPGPEPIVVGPGGSASSGSVSGGTMPYAQAAPEPIVVGPAVPRYLSITTGALAGSMLPLSGQPITIGRAAGNTLVFEDDYASSHHARLFQAAEGWVIEDLNSTNGTFIEGAPLTGAALLPVGVPVTIGHSTFKLVV